jgi:hypothetical protein
MTTNPDDPLTSEEFASLREIRKDLLAGPIPPEHMEKLLKLGLITKRSGVEPMHYNFVHIHQTLKVTPAMAAGVTDRLWEINDIVRVLEQWDNQC